MDELFERWGAVDESALALTVSTAEDAVTAIEWARWERQRCDIGSPDAHERFVSSMLDAGVSAIRALLPSAGAPPSFAPAATAQPDDGALIAGVLPPGDVVSQSDRARGLVARDRAAWDALCDRPMEGPEYERAVRLTDARNLAVGNLTASPARTPRDLAAKASVILAGLGDKPAGWEHGITPFVDLVQSTAADAVRLGSTGMAHDADVAADFAALARLTEEADRLARLSSNMHSKTVWPELPEALLYRVTDGPKFGQLAYEGPNGIFRYGATSVTPLQLMSFDDYYGDRDGRSSRRREEILTAYKAWLAENAAASTASGLDAVEADCSTCARQMLAQRDAMLDRPARALDDVLRKAAVFAWWYVDEGEKAMPTMLADRARLLAKREGTAPLALSLGVLADLVIMAEARGFTLSSPQEPAAADAPPEVQAVTAGDASAPRIAAASLPVRPRSQRRALADNRFTLINARLAPLIRREYGVQGRLDRLETDDVPPALRRRLDRVSTRMVKRIDRWTRQLMRHDPCDSRTAAVKASVYIELVVAGWTGGTDDLGEKLALSVCDDWDWPGFVDGQWTCWGRLVIGLALSFWKVLS